MPVRPERLCAELTRHTPEDAIVVVDTGHAGMWMGGMFDLTSPRQSYMRSAGHLGWAFPAGLGAKAACPDRPVVVFTGDAGFYYHLAEVETAARWGLNTVTVVNNNGGGNQSKRGFDRAYGGTQTEQARELWTYRQVNFAKVAENLGALGIRVEQPADFAPALQPRARRQPPRRHRRGHRHRGHRSRRGRIGPVRQVEAMPEQVAPGAARLPPHASLDTLTRRSSVARARPSSSAAAASGTPIGERRRAARHQQGGGRVQHHGMTERNEVRRLLAREQRAHLLRCCPPACRRGSRRTGAPRRPASSGLIWNWVTLPSSSAATYDGAAIEISSVPSMPCTSHAFSEPSARSVSAIGRSRCWVKTPVSCRLTPAGLVSGPRMLKIVRTPSSTRTGMTWRMAA